MGRPTAGTKYCPKCRSWDSRKRLYQREGKKWIPIGWRCVGCDEVVLDGPSTGN